MNGDDFHLILARFFQDSFAEDPVGVGDWLAQGDDDVDVFFEEFNRRYPKESVDA